MKLCSFSPLSTVTKSIRVCNMVMEVLLKLILNTPKKSVFYKVNSHFVGSIAAPLTLLKGHYHKLDLLLRRRQPSAFNC